MEYNLKALISTLNPICRQSLEDAAGLCVSHGHHSIEVEHFLLKLLDRKGTDLAAVLTHFGVDPQTVRQELKSALLGLREGNTGVPTFAAQVPKLIKEAWLISSLHLGATRVRSGALLIALRETEGVRDRVTRSAPSLRELDPQRLRNEVGPLIRNTAEAGSAQAPMGARPPMPEAPTSGPAPSGEAAPEGASAPPPMAIETPYLDQYTVDLTAKARGGGIDPIIGRDSEIRQAVDVLTRRRQNNPILTGEAGVGKTAVVEGLAQRIADGDVPPTLQNVSLRMLDLALLQAGAGVKGEFESRLKSVIAEVNASVNPVILFIDEAHTLIGAGGSEGQGDAANLLKPALARGELRTVAATTWAEYKRYFEADSALARRFQVIKVEEPTPEKAVDMLRGLVGHLEDHHQVRVLDEAVHDAVHLSARYITGRRLPDKAISVLDTACARVSLGLRSTPELVEQATRRQERLTIERARLEKEHARHGRLDERLAELDDALDEVEAELEAATARWAEEQRLANAVLALEDQLDSDEAAEAADDFVDASTPNLADTQRALEAARAELAALQGQKPMVPLHVDSAVVADVIEGWTGIPAGKMMTDEVAAVLSLEDALGERVIGQRQALDAVARRIRTSRAVLDDPGKPVGVFLLLGPSGVGKTETAIALADAFYGGERNMITINMSEYQEAHTVAQLKGAPPGYVGYGRGGVLTEAVRRRPYTVVLLDEVEKAHPDVLELFYQVFDKGTLEDGEGTVVDFRHTLILLTSNVGDSIIEAACAAGDPPNPEALLEALQPALKRVFPAAFLGRLVAIPYYALTREELARIVTLKLKRVQDRFTTQHKAALSWTPLVVDRIVARCTEAHTGARNIDHILSHSLLPRLSTTVLSQMAEGEPVADVHLSIGPDGDFYFASPGEAPPEPEPQPEPQPEPIIAPKPRPTPAPPVVTVIPEPEPEIVYDETSNPPPTDCPEPEPEIVYDETSNPPPTDRKGPTLVDVAPVHDDALDLLTATEPSPAVATPITFAPEPEPEPAPQLEPAPEPEPALVFTPQRQPELEPEPEPQPEPQPPVDETAMTVATQLPQGPLGRFFAALARLFGR